MIKTIVAFLLIIILANFLLADDQDRQREFVRLIMERSQLQMELAQQPPEESAESLRKRIREINKRVADMGIGMPDSPEPPLSELDRTDLSIPRLPTPIFSDKRYKFNLNTSHAYNSNYFQAVADTPQQAVWLTNVSTSFDFTVVQEYKHQFTAGVDLQRNFVRGIQNADWSAFGANLSYAYNTHRFTFHGLYTPRKLNFITFDSIPGFSRTMAFGADYTALLNRNMRIRAFYRFNNIRYPEFSSRNVKVHFGAGDAQYRFHDLFMPGIGFEYSNAMAQTDNYNYWEMTPVLLLGSRLGRVVSINLRYRYKMRNYTIDDRQYSNFGRRDWRHDAYVYLGIGIGRHFYLIAFGRYMENFSSRAYRSFSSMSGGATMQIQFPR